jgi:uncharacterized protein (DUF1330 family)
MELKWTPGDFAGRSRFRTSPSHRIASMSATPESANLADLNPIAVTELSERAGEGPVVMLNLLDFKPAGGFERYAEYAEAVTPLLEKVGGRVVFAGNANVPVIGPSKWDMVILVEYPTRQAFLDMTSSPEYVAIARLRSEGLERSELHPLDPQAPG